MPRHFVKLSNLTPTVTRAPVDSFINLRDQWQGNGKRSKRAQPTRGATGTISKKIRHLDLERSAAAADAIARERQTKRAYAEWFASMNSEDRTAAEALGVKGFLPTGNRAGARDSEPDIDFLDPSDLPAASISATPVDEIEPQRLSVEIESLSDAQIDGASDTFSDSLTWALEADGLVQMGRRLCAMVRGLRSELANGLRHDPHLEAAFIQRVAGDRVACGIIFGRVLEWASRATSVGQLGERLYLLAYVLRPALIGARTLASLGAIDGQKKTRQAKDKIAQCLRDTFAGLKARTMRGELTRIKCQLAPRADSKRLEAAA